jgi:hypothetical protein
MARPQLQGREPDLVREEPPVAPLETTTEGVAVAVVVAPVRAAVLAEANSKPQLQS